MGTPLVGTALIEAVYGEKAWKRVTRLVKEDASCPHESFNIYADVDLFYDWIPARLAVAADGKIVAHSEIRDLGTARYGIRMAGLSNMVVTPGYRDRGIFTALIVLGNILLDRSDFLFVAARVKKGYEERYMAQYPGFIKVKERDPQDAAWILRAIQGRAYTDEMLNAVIEHLEKVKKW